MTKHLEERNRRTVTQEHDLPVVDQSGTMFTFTSSHSRETGELYCVGCAGWFEYSGIIGYAVVKSDHREHREHNRIVFEPAPEYHGEMTAWAIRRVAEQGGTDLGRLVVYYAHDAYTFRVLDQRREPGLLQGPYFDSYDLAKVAGFQAAARLHGAHIESSEAELADIRANREAEERMFNRIDGHKYLRSEPTEPSEAPLAPEGGTYPFRVLRTTGGFFARRLYGEPDDHPVSEPGFVTWIGDIDATDEDEAIRLIRLDKEAK